MNNQKLIDLVNQIEQSAGSLIVRERVNDEWQNVSLIELPAHLAIKHICRILRARLKYETSETGLPVQRPPRDNWAR